MVDGNAQALHDHSAMIVPRYFRASKNLDISTSEIDSRAKGAERKSGVSDIRYRDLEAMGAGEWWLIFSRLNLLGAENPCHEIRIGGRIRLRCTHCLAPSL